MLFVNCSRRCEAFLASGEVVCETLSREGAHLYHDGTIYESGLETREVDPTGVGDAFSGTFLAAYIHNDDPVLAAREVNAAAAAHVKAQGHMESSSRPSGSYAQCATSRREFRKRNRYSQETRKGIEG